MTDKVPAAEMMKIQATLIALDCIGYKTVKKEEQGIYEIDDAKCKMGTVDIKLDKDYTVLLISRYDRRGASHRCRSKASRPAARLFVCRSPRENSDDPFAECRHFALGWRHARRRRPYKASETEGRSALAAAYEEAWRNAYQGVIPHLSLERMIARRGLRWWESALRKRTPLLVLDFGGAAAGYVTYGRCRLGRTPFQGEIFELYLHPIYQGFGLGEKLFDGARMRLAELRLKGLLVWALTDNESACGFYLRLGGKPVAEGAESFGDVSLRKVAFAWA